MGSGSSKSAAPPQGAASAAAHGDASSSSQSSAVSMRDEAIGMVIDGIVLYGMFVSAKYLYKVS